jgi:anti-sigma regulatory factor (Ser/Thr protein kinase)
VGLAREVLAGLAETIALSREQYDDIRTAVTEACNNVVQHAYGDGEGPLELHVSVVRDAVEVSVRDEGIGMAGVAGEGAGELEIGLPVMLALTDRLEVGRGACGGTEVQMRFLTPGVEALDRQRAQSDGPPEIVLPEVDVSVRVAFSSAELAGAILPRLASALAARAHFSADRVSDVQLLSDAIASRATALANGLHLEVALGAGRRHLHLQIGPLMAGGAERLRSHSTPVIERLADEATVTSIGRGEVLLLRVLDRP